MQGVGHGGITGIDPATLNPAFRVAGRDEYYHSISPEVLATDGQTVQRWGDISGNLYDIEQSTATNKAIYDSVKKALEFDGVNHFYVGNSMDSVWTANEFTIIAHCRISDLSVTHDFVSKNWNSSTAGEFVFFLVADTGLGNRLRFVSLPTGPFAERLDVITDYFQLNTESKFTFSITVNKTITATQDAYSFYVNEDKQTTIILNDGVKTMPSNTSPTDFFFQRNSSANRLKGDVHEIITLPTKLNDIKTAGVHRFLKYRY